MLGKKRNTGIFLETNLVPEKNSFIPEDKDVIIPSGEILEASVQKKTEPDERETARTKPESAIPRTHNLFFTPEDECRDFSEVLRHVQEHISSQYSTLLTNGNTEEVKSHIKRYVTKYVQDSRVAVKGMTSGQLVDALYTEMAEYSFLTKYIFGTGIEEIDSATRS